MLERLTAKKVAQARREHATKVEAWYALGKLGYTPDEIGIYQKGNGGTAHDIRHLVRKYAKEEGLPIPASFAPLREPPPRKEPPADWRRAFREGVMRTGLNLVLSQSMLEHLSAVADNVRFDMDQRLFVNHHGTTSTAQQFILTTHALLKRGLLIQKLRDGRPAGVRLSPAGELVVNLLKETGIFVVHDAALRKHIG